MEHKPRAEIRVAAYLLSVSPRVTIFLKNPTKHLLMILKYIVNLQSAAAIGCRYKYEVRSSFQHKDRKHKCEGRGGETQIKLRHGEFSLLDYIRMCF